MGLPYLYIAAAGGAYLLLQLSIYVYRSRGNHVNLPGPKGWPLIGIGLDLPKQPRKLLKEYREKYGETFKMRLGWYDWVFFNDPQSVREVFDRQVIFPFA